MASKNFVSSAFAHVAIVNEWLATRFNTTHRAILTIEIGMLAGLGFTMMQIGEHLVAVMVWLLLCSLWIAKIFHGDLEAGNRALAVVERVVQTFAALFICAALITITDIRRGNDLWSNVMRLWVKPPSHRHTLSSAEREKFEEPLKEMKQPQTPIHIYCAPGDEVDCEYAATLIPLFGEAGWDVSRSVERITLGRPEPGIVIALHGNIKPEEEANLKWNQGEWTQILPEVGYVRQAFVNIGIEPDSTSGSVIPEKQINIYVGREREDESAPTDMTQSFRNLERAKREHPEIGAK